MKHLYMLLIGIGTMALGLVAAGAVYYVIFRLVQGLTAIPRYPFFVYLGWTLVLIATYGLGRMLYIDYMKYKEAKLRDL